MRRRFWLRGLIGLITAAVGAGIAWAGYALMAPERAGLKALPPEANLLPFDRMFWATALMLLGAAAVFHALPHPFWTRTKRRRPAAPAVVVLGALNEPPVAQTAPEPLMAEPIRAEPSPDGLVEPAIELKAAPVLHADAPLEHASNLEPGSAPNADLQSDPDPHLESEPATDHLSDATSEASHPAPFDLAAPAVAKACDEAEALRQQGRAEEALERYQSVLPDARAARNADPSDAAAVIALASVLKGVGDIHDEEGRLGPAIDAYEECLRLRRTLAAALPQSDTRKRALSLALERLADAREARGHRSQALFLYEESLPIAEALAAKQPDDPVLKTDLMATRERLRALRAWISEP